MFITKPQRLPVPIFPSLPEVYQIEVSRICNLKCINCPTQFFKRKDETPFIDVSLVEKVVNEGGLAASYFVELQMSGEPLLHPDLAKIIQIIKPTGVKIGMSTNATMFGPKIYHILDSLDYITISLNSITNYREIHKGGYWMNAKDAIEGYLEHRTYYPKKNVIDIQTIELEGWENESALIKEAFGNYDVNFRHFPNCYLSYFFPEEKYECQDLCLNPWMSASICANGNVTACCISQGDDIILGNVKDQTLEEIWAGDEIKKLREEHQTRTYRPVCARCYMRSTAMFHFCLFFSSISKRF
jgi:radical SAM protein with 4Fe4S-binding SPASM domain